MSDPWSAPTAESFLAAFEPRLADAAEGWRSSWPERGARTRALKGNRYKGEATKRAGSILQETFGDLGYSMGAHMENERVLQFEWLQKDVIAVNGLGMSWGKGCWRGQYRIDVVCEVENDFYEFDLTMRGMLDIRAALRVGIFFDSRPDPTVEQPPRNREPPYAAEALSRWRPCEAGLIGTSSPGEELLVIVLSPDEPKVSSAFALRYEGGWTSRRLRHP